MLPTGGDSTLGVIKLKESLTEAIRERERIGRLALWWWGAGGGAPGGGAPSSTCSLLTRQRDGALGL